MNRKIYLVLEENESFVDVREIEPRTIEETILDFQIMIRIIEDCGYKIIPSDNNYDA